MKYPADEQGIFVAITKTPQPVVACGVVEKSMADRSPRFARLVSPDLPAGSVSFPRRCPTDRGTAACVATTSGLSAAHTSGDEKRWKTSLIERVGYGKAVDDLIDQAIGDCQLVLVRD